MSDVTFRHSRVWAACHGKLWRHMLLPKEISVGDDALQTDERLEVITFWRREIDQMPRAKLASVTIRKGFVWDTIIVETTGGAKAIEMEGISKTHSGDLAAQIRQLISEKAS